MKTWISIDAKIPRSHRNLPKSGGDKGGADWKNMQVGDIVLSDLNARLIKLCIM